MESNRIQLSDKHTPLFELLEARNVVNSEEFNTLSKEERQYWFQLSQVDTVLEYGGRDSGKTFAESVFIPIAVKDYNHRVLYTRYTMNSTDQSISEALNERMALMECYDEFTFSNNTYQCNHNDGKIFITGQKTSSGNQTAKLKSLENFSIFVTDEAEELKTFEEWDKIRKSIRAKDVQCISLLVFNPPTKEHWLHTEFFEEMGVQAGFCGVKDNVLYIHTSYLDNIEHVAEHNLREYEKLRVAYETFQAIPKKEREDAPPKLVKQAHKYEHVVLGGFKDAAEGVIYPDWEIGEFNTSFPYVHGIDFGFDDPDACIKVAVDHKQKKIYLDEVLYQNGLGSRTLGEMLVDLIGRTDLIVGDAAHKRLIRDLYNDHGLNIKKCRKGGGSVQRGIKTIQGYTLVVTERSKNIVKALNNYVWHDKRSGVPRHEWSHIPDAFRYAIIELVEY